MKTYRLHITGKVQGVWYRASAKDKALSLGITGKIWNAPDGSVDAIIKGHEDNVKEFIDWCKEGPPLAKVDDVIVQEMPDNNEGYAGFEISRSQA